MSLPDDVLERVNRLLSAWAGSSVRVVQSEPVTEGWSAQFSPWPWVVRCSIEADRGAVPGSVIVKVCRPVDHSRSEPERLYHEQVALEFLTSIGSTVGPRLFAADDEAGILVMEDLGAGSALEDLLVGSDASAASHGLVAYAEALGRLHAATIGHAEEYYQLRSRYGPVDPTFDRISILGVGIEDAFRQLREVIASRPYLPALHDAGSDVDEMLRMLAEPGPYLALSNGDTCPTN
ncbi:MAG: hypothetical protein J2P36_29800, partial [Ktedonobacteraceae bacterium]|nr:hypothetical protein [Ktedonobacteraceae bacterium]